MNRNPYNLSRPGSSGSVTGAEGSVGSMDPGPSLSNTPNTIPMNSEDEDSDGRGKFLTEKGEFSQRDRVST